MRWRWRWRGLNRNESTHECVCVEAGRAEAGFFLKGEDEEFTAERWKRGNV